MKSRVFALHFADEASAIKAKTLNLKEFTRVYNLFEQCLYTRDVVVVIFRMSELTLGDIVWCCYQPIERRLMLAVAEAHCKIRCFCRANLT